MKLRDLLTTMKDVGKTIDASNIWIVGGCVRDKLLNRLDKINDLDITTGDEKSSLLAEKLFVELQKVNSSIKKVNQEDHSSIFFGNIKLDFSSNFKAPNIETILNKMGIDSPNPLQMEVYSRDFSCNSLLLSLDLKEIKDVTGKGKQDIKNKIIKTVLSPEITLMTNRNRVVRAIYLAAKLDFEVDESIIEYVAKNPDSIKLASDKTIAEKINESLIHNKEKTIDLISKMNLWNHIPINNELLPYFAKFKSNAK